jgi:hypothetical protein
MIRRDKTHYDPKNPNNWANSMFQDNARDEKTRDEKKQDGLLKSWKNMYTNANDGELKRLEVMRRISAATEGDTAAKRTQERIKQHNVAAEVDRRQRNRRQGGQTEEGFISELKDFGDDFRQDLRAAQKKYGQ